MSVPMFLGKVIDVVFNKSGMDSAAFASLTEYSFYSLGSLFWEVSPTSLESICSEMLVSLKPYPSRIIVKDSYYLLPLSSQDCEKS